VELLSELCSYARTDSSLLYCGEHSRAFPVAYFVQLEMPLLPRVGPCLKERDHLAASIHTFLQPSGHARHVPLDRGVIEVRSGHWVTAANGQEAFPHDLHVFLRHRLCLQAEVSEGAVAVPVGDLPDHLAVPDMPESCSLCRHGPDLESARLATPAAAGEHENLFAVKLAVLVRP